MFDSGKSSLLTARKRNTNSHEFQRGLVHFRPDEYYPTPAPNADLVRKPLLTGRHLIILNRSGHSRSKKTPGRVRSHEDSPSPVPEAAPARVAQLCRIRQRSLPFFSNSLRNCFHERGGDKQKPSDRTKAHRFGALCLIQTSGL